jgi:hypothetical protein
MTQIVRPAPDVTDALAEDDMLGYWFKEFAELGHWFDRAHGKCIHCGTPTIDLYEDGSYGSVRACVPA